ncbi:MAG TPA: BON domain-containing protein [Thermoanaerobaculia bacterium]|jgi:hyperosmotically inducible protein|nr:BON domain-containing protein [Thermoanaerobaculia bacterium]
MNRKLAFVTLFLFVFAAACGSMNRVVHTDEVMKADVKGKIAEVYPKETTEIGVTVDHGVVTLTGTVATATEAQKIGEAAGSVHGVTQVINNIQVK